MSPSPGPFGDLQRPRLVRGGHADGCLDDLCGDPARRASFGPAVHVEGAHAEHRLRGRPWQRRQAEGGQRGVVQWEPEDLLGTLGSVDVGTPEGEVSHRRLIPGPRLPVHVSVTVDGDAFLQHLFRVLVPTLGARELQVGEVPVGDGVHAVLDRVDHVLRRGVRELHPVLRQPQRGAQVLAVVPRMLQELTEAALVVDVLVVVHGENELVLRRPGLERVDDVARNGVGGLHCGDHSASAEYRAADVLEGDRGPRPGGLQLVQHRLVELEQVVPRRPGFADVGEAADRRLVEQLDGDDVRVLLPDLGQQLDEVHVRVEERRLVVGVAVGEEEAVASILHLLRHADGALAPGRVAVVHSHVDVADRHEPRVAHIAAVAVVQPRILVIRDNDLGNGRAEGVDETPQDRRDDQLQRPVRSGDVVLALVGLLHLHRHPHRHALASVGPGEGVVVVVQEDIDPLFGERLDRALQVVHVLLVDLARLQRHRALQHAAQAHDGDDLPAVCRRERRVLRLHCESPRVLANDVHVREVGVRLEHVVGTQRQDLLATAHEGVVEHGDALNRRRPPLRCRRHVASLGLEQRGLLLLRRTLRRAGCGRGRSGSAARLQCSRRRSGHSRSGRQEPGQREEAPTTGLGCHRHVDERRGASVPRR
mmetsp:Transcript_38283/g.118940  ORF Transcript_38283/g.118940 Transcript_38283/m.118940 type:complete len:649 (-) Transcript_38283:28-1974(-)